MDRLNDPAEEFLREGLADVGDVDDRVLHVLVNAARYMPEPSSGMEISTTRLFLGALDAAEAHPAFAALRSALLGMHRGDEAVADLRGRFEKLPPSTTPHGAATRLSDNAKLIVRGAISAGRGRAAADGLVGALMTETPGLLWRRLRGHGITPDALAEAYRAILGTAKDVDPPRLSVPTFTSDNPWAHTVTDSIGVEAEAAAFARLVLHTEVRPPLAIGVFGDWGTGKTYFMRKVHENVESMTKGSEDRSDSGTSFHADVVQIRFNAWHYVETNLWASIVDHIFSELDRWIASKTAREDANSLLSRLTTARSLTIDAAQSLVDRRKEQQAAETKLQQAEAELADARLRAVVQPSDLIESFEEVFRTEIVSIKDEATRRAIEQTGLDRLTDSATAFRAKLNSLTDESRRGSVTVQQLMLLLGSKRWLLTVVGTIVLAPVVLVLIKDVLATTPASKWFLPHVSDLVVAASGLLAGLTAVGGRMLGAVSPVLDRLGTFRNHLEAQLEAKLAQETAAREAAAAEAVAKAAEVERARSRLEAARRALASAMDEYAAETGFRRLQRFIQDRATGDTYAKHLGLVATVRRDFEQLSNLMLGEPLDPQLVKAREAYEKQVEQLIAAAAEHLTAEEAQELRESARPVTEHSAAQDVRLGRILLYIDDLDRCPPAKVLDVLQAVHMLLTFQLFVVFVAVDARWVTRALITQYPHLLIDTHGADAAGQNGATPHDYLEKIFQIPYWVRPLTPDASTKYLTDLLATATPPPDLRTHRPAPTEQAAPADGPPRLALGPTRSIAAPDAPSTGDGTPGGKRFGHAEILRLSSEEHAFMKSLAPYAGSSPRRLLRFVNVYRVITSAMDATTRERLIADGTYRSLLTHLAIVTGASDILNDWLELLHDDGPKPNGAIASMKELIARLDADELFGGAAPELPRGWPSLRGAVNEYSLAAGDVPDSLAGLRGAWPAVARRYSFLG